MDQRREEFNKKLKVLIGTKNKNNVYMSKNLYEKLLNDVKNGKTNRRRSSQRYDIITEGNEKKLVVTDPDGSGNNEKRTQYFVTTDELFDVIHKAHLRLGHVGRNRLIKELHNTYKNVTTESIMLYLKLCKDCQQKSTGGRNRNSSILESCKPTIVRTKNEINKSLNNGDSSSSSSSSDNSRMNDDVDPDHQNQSTTNTIDVFSKSITTRNQAKNKSQANNKTRTSNILKKVNKHNELVESNSDVLFLMSFATEMGEMTPSQKMEFKTGMLELVNRIRYS